MNFNRPIRVSDDDIKEAIKLRESECFSAMNIANALAGQETNAWWLVRNNTLEELKCEADRRGVSKEANQ